MLISIMEIRPTKSKIVFKIINVIKFNESLLSIDNGLLKILILIFEKIIKDKTKKPIFY